MPPKGRGKRKADNPRISTCEHARIQLEPSTHADDVGFQRATPVQRARAQGVVLKSLEDDPHTFPAPLVLPGDEIALWPKLQGQSFTSWANYKHRNVVIPERRTIYIATQPSYAPEVTFAQSWCIPTTVATTAGPSTQSQFKDVARLADFTRAFYHPLPVRILPESAYRFAPWSTKDLKRLQKSTRLGYDPAPDHALIGLETPSEMVGIRVRPTPNYDFPHQLDLEDLLQAVMESLPDDAYALCMLFDHDLYEDEEDEFVCGRAYGGSRVSVVSTARYNPALDPILELDLSHVWPLSHCKDFINKSCGKAGKMRRKIDAEGPGPSDGEQGPLDAAIAAIRSFRLPSNAPELPDSRWLCRLFRTVVHELGHCFAMGHCVHYACLMQGSSSVKEDHRQPMYLCPIDLAKVLSATGATEAQHLQALIAFTEKVVDEGIRVEGFVALGSWAQKRLDTILGRTRDEVWIDLTED